MVVTCVGEPAVRRGKFLETLGGYCGEVSSKLCILRQNNCSSCYKPVNQRYLISDDHHFKPSFSAFTSEIAFQSSLLECFFFKSVFFITISTLIFLRFTPFVILYSQFYYLKMFISMKFYFLYKEKRVSVNSPPLFRLPTIDRRPLPIVDYRQATTADCRLSTFCEVNLFLISSLF